MAVVILVIDDDDVWRGIVARTLEAAGYEVLLAADGKAGLAICEQRRPDLVITDVFMPEGDGLEVLGALKTAEHRPKVLAMSGSNAGGRVDFLNVASRLGADRALRKPFEPAALRQAVQDLLAAAASES
jgi:CheY-like chemotaxis protein